MATVLDEYLIRFGFDANTEGLDRVVSKTKAAQGIFESIKAPFDAFNEAFTTLQTVSMLAGKALDAMFGTATRTALAADNLAETATELGIASKDLEFFSFAAEQSGSSADSMSFALMILNRELANAATGSKEAMASFARFGVHIKDSNGRMKEGGEVMNDILGKLSLIEDPAKRSAAAVDLFGRAGLGLKNFLSTTPKELEELRQVFEALGGPTSDKLQQLGDRYDNNLKKIGVAGQSLRRVFAESVMPAINKFTDRVVDFVVKNGPMLQEFFANLGRAIGWFAELLSSAAETWMTAAEYTAKFLQNFLGIIRLSPEVKAALLILGGALLAAFAPAAVAIALLYLAVDDFLAFLEGRDSVFGDFVERWSAWVEQLKKDHPFLATFVSLFEKLALALGAFIKLSATVATGPFKLIAGFLGGLSDTGTLAGAQAGGREARNEIWSDAKNSGFLESIGDIFKAGFDVPRQGIKYMPQLTSSTTNAQQSTQNNIQVTVNANGMGDDLTRGQPNLVRAITEALNGVLRDSHVAVGGK